VKIMQTAANTYVELVPFSTFRRGTIKGQAHRDLLIEKKGAELKNGKGKRLGRFIGGFPLVGNRRTSSNLPTGQHTAVLQYDKTKK
jgi:hypothetical protein